MMTRENLLAVIFSARFLRKHINLGPVVYEGSHCIDLTTTGLGGFRSSPLQAEGKPPRIRRLASYFFIIHSFHRSNIFASFSDHH